MAEKLTPRWGISFGYNVGESGWNVGYDNSHKLLDVLLQPAIINTTTTAPPGSPTNGDVYIVAATATGAWAGKETQLAARIEGAWYYVTPKAGARVWNIATSSFYYFNGTVWGVETSTGTRGANPMSVVGSLIYGGVAGAETALLAGAEGTSLQISAGIPAWLASPTGGSVRAVTGTTDTILSTDTRKLVTYSNASAIAVTLPQANGTGFVAPFWIAVQNTGAGVVTITPTTSTIDGAASVVLNQNEGILIYSDSTNYKTMRGKGAAAGAPSGSAGGGLSGTYPNPDVKVSIGIACSDETTAITTGTAKATFRMPHAMTLTAVRASLTTASSSGIPTFDINEGGTTILSTKLTIDASEKTSTTAATAAVISDSALADDAEITIDFDVAGTGAAGVKIWLIGTRA